MLQNVQGAAGTKMQRKFEFVGDRGVLRVTLPNTQAKLDRQAIEADAMLRFVSAGTP
jgi:hypothetical protein